MSEVGQDTTRESKHDSGSESSTHAADAVISLVGEQTESPVTYPDGGMHAWLTVWACFLLSVTSHGQLSAFGVFQTYYAEHQLESRSNSDISWIGSLQLGLIYIGGLVLGRVFDAYGAKTLLVTGWILSAFCLMMLSLSKTYYQIFLSQGLGLGIAFALQFYPIVSVPNHWFMKRRSLALGIVVGGSSLSGVILPIMLSRLFRSIGFPWAVRTLAFMCFVLQGISIPFVKERFPPQKELSRLNWSLKSSDMAFVMHVLSGFFVAFGLYTPSWYIELNALQQGVSPNLAFYLISILNGSGLVGRIALGEMADKLGRFNTMICTIFLCCVSCLAIWTSSHSIAELIVFAIFFGFASGAYLSVSPSCTVQLTSDPSRIGERVGIFMACMTPGIVTGPSIAGALISAQHGSYLGMEILVGTFIAVGGVFAVIARILGEPRVKACF